MSYSSQPVMPLRGNSVQPTNKVLTREEITIRTPNELPRTLKPFTTTQDLMTIDAGCTQSPPFLLARLSGGYTQGTHDYVIALPGDKIRIALNRTTKHVIATIKDYYAKDGDSSASAVLLAVNGYELGIDNYVFEADTDDFPNITHVLIALSQINISSTSLVSATTCFLTSPSSRRLLAKDDAIKNMRLSAGICNDTDHAISTMEHLLIPSSQTLGTSSYFPVRVGYNLFVKLLGRTNLISAMVYGLQLSESGKPIGLYLAPEGAPIMANGELFDFTEPVNFRAIDAAQSLIVSEPQDKPKRIGAVNMSARNLVKRFF